MQKLKQEYEQFKKQKYVSVLDKRLSQLQTAATNLMG